MKLDINKYPGAKRNSGLDKWIINMIPECETFIEGFAGSGHITETIINAGGQADFILIEKSEEVLKQLRSKFLEHIHTCAIWDMDTLTPHKWLGKDNVVMYLDPPYLKYTRSSNRDMYHEDWITAHHSTFLGLVKRWNRRGIQIIISHPKCEMYDQLLLDDSWTRHEFKTSNRAGVTTEYVYRNFNPKQYKLLTSAFVGDNKTKRQNLKRRSETMINKVKRSEDLHERQYLIERFIEKTNPYL